MWFQAIAISRLALFCNVGNVGNVGGVGNVINFAHVALPSGGAGAIEFGVGARRLLFAKGPPAKGASVAASSADTASKADRSETELMLEALVRADGESPNAKRIDRAVAQAKADAKRDQVAPATVWKDPFAEDPTRPIPVRSRFRSTESRGTESKGKELAVARRELARARAETAVAQADAARAKADAAKAEASAALAQALAARHEAVAARAACVDPSAGKHAMSSLVRAEQRSRPRDALVNASLPRVARKSGGRPVEPARASAAPPLSPPPVVAAAPDPLIVPLADDALVASHPGGGILVVPITR